MSQGTRFVWRVLVRAALVGVTGYAYYYLRTRSGVAEGIRRKEEYVIETLRRWRNSMQAWYEQTLQELKMGEKIKIEDQVNDEFVPAFQPLDSPRLHDFNLEDIIHSRRRISRVLDETSRRQKKYKVETRIQKQQLLLFKLHSTPLLDRGPEICAKCSQSLLGHCSTKALNLHFHLDCVCCHLCSAPLDKFFAISNHPLCHSCYNFLFGEICQGCGADLQSYFEKETSKFCPTCYEILFKPICSVCRDFISGTFHLNAFWHEELCAQHQIERIQCDGCGRSNAPQLNFQSVAPNQHLCIDCCESMISSSDAEWAQSLFEQIRFFFRTKKVSFAQNVFVLLVDRKTLQRLSEREEREESKKVLGLTLSHQVTQTLSLGLCPATAKRVFGKTQVRITERKQSVAGIAVLHSRPCIVVAATLAHEFMHAWFALHPFARQMQSRVCEGACELAAYLYLLYVKETTKEEWSYALAVYLMEGMEKNEDEIYGEGFRQAKLAWENSERDEKSFFEYVAQHGEFPLE